MIAGWIESRLAAGQAVAIEVTGGLFPIFDSLMHFQGNLPVLPEQDLAYALFFLVTTDRKEELPRLAVGELMRLGFCFPHLAVSRCWRRAASFHGLRTV
jgi:hypothetical protein